MCKRHYDLEMRCVAENEDEFGSVDVIDLMRVLTALRCSELRPVYYFLAKCLKLDFQEYQFLHSRSELEKKLRRILVDQGSQPFPVFVQFIKDWMNYDSIENLLQMNQNNYPLVGLKRYTLDKESTEFRFAHALFIGGKLCASNVHKEEDVKGDVCPDGHPLDPQTGCCQIDSRDVKTLEDLSLIHI